MIPQDIQLEALLYEFRECNDLNRMEELADLLGETGDSRSIELLLYRLGDDHVQAERDVEDAVCDALVKLGVMERLGNLNFRFREHASLKYPVADIINKYRQIIPHKYKD